MFFLQTEQ